ncbi:uncharacterized protein [Procambarus clarkii]|uniref:uncharacterized protein isoform X1 n=2 Tax=Procambarus clarkii TaxID=6728 RepID=UPI003742610D
MKVTYELLLLWVAVVSLWSSFSYTTAAINHHIKDHPIRYFTERALPSTRESNSDNNVRGEFAYNKIWISKPDRRGLWKRQINNKGSWRRPEHGRDWTRINITSPWDLNKRSASQTSFSALKLVTSNKDLASPLFGIRDFIVDSKIPIEVSTKGSESSPTVSEAYDMDTNSLSIGSKSSEINSRALENLSQGQGEASIHLSQPNSNVRSAATDTKRPVAQVLSAGTSATMAKSPYVNSNLRCFCPNKICYNFEIGSSYLVRDLVSKETVQSTVDYVDSEVCTGESKRVGIESREELHFLVSCLLCNNTNFGGTKNMTNILTSGLVMSEDQDQLKIHNGVTGEWTGWDTAVDPSVTEKGIVVLDPNTGMPVAEQHIMPRINYALLLPGDFKMSCDAENTYEEWGLLSYNAKKSAIIMTGYVICETKMNFTTLAPQTSTTTTTTTTQGSKTPSSTTVTTTSSLSTTSKTPDGCCQLPQTNLMDLTELASGTLTNMPRGVSEVCPGQVVEVGCRLGYSGSLELGCDATGPSLVVTTDSCVLNWILDVQDMVESRNVSAVAIADQVKNNTLQHQQLTYNDLSTLNGVVSNLNSLFQDQVKEINETEQRVVQALNYTTKVLGITSDILSVPPTWTGLKTMEAGQMGSFLLLNLETSGFIVADQVTNDTVTFLEPQVNMTVISTPREELSGKELYLPGPSEPTFLHLPQDFVTLFPEKQPQAKLVGFFLQQQAASLALPASLSRNVPHARYKIINSLVVSLTLDKAGNSANFTSLTDGVLLSFRHTVKESGPYFRDLYRDARPGEVATPVPATARCVYWEDSFSMWAPEGCDLVNSTPQATFCRCSHLTMIAILTDLHHHVGRDPVLDTLGTILTSASCLSLLAAFSIFHFIKSLQGPRTAITKQLCVSLGCSHLLLLLLLDPDFLKQSKTMCEVSATILHYWVTASVCWMLSQGAHLLQTVVHVLSPTTAMPAYWLVGYGVPAVVVVVTLLVAYGAGTWLTQNAYAPPDSEYCWLSTDGYIWAFTGPLLVVIVVNTLSMIMALRSAAVLRANKRKTLPQQVRLWVKGCFSLNCLLGCTWVFGLLYINTGHVFAYLFTILNASQGIMILVLHCFVNRTVRKAVISNLPECLFKCLPKRGKPAPMRPPSPIRKSVVPSPASSNPQRDPKSRQHPTACTCNHRQHNIRDLQHCGKCRRHSERENCVASNLSYCSSNDGLHGDNDHRQYCNNLKHKFCSNYQQCSDDDRLQRSDDDRQQRSDDDRQQHRPDDDRQHRSDDDRQQHRPDDDRQHRSDDDRQHRSDDDRQQHHPDDDRQQRSDDDRQHSSRMAPAPLQISPSLTNRVSRAGSEWSNSTRFSYISDGPGSENSSVRRISLESYGSSISDESLTSSPNLASSGSSEGSYRAIVVSPEMPQGPHDDRLDGVESDNLRFVPGFDSILECDERSPRSENAISFF